MKTVLDTSVVSALMRKDPGALGRLRELKPSSTLLTGPVAAEILYGVARLGQGTKRRNLLEREYSKLRRVLTWQDWTEPAAKAFGEIKAELERTGAMVEDLGIAIAAIALELRANLATFNPDRFDRIPGLRIAAWS